MGMSGSHPLRRGYCYVYMLPVVHFLFYFVVSPLITSQRSTPLLPSKLVTKLRDLGINSALCDWILNFLTGRPQAVRMGSTTSSTLTLNTGTPKSCVGVPVGCHPIAWTTLCV
ncbi:hypothetical protein L3Q82_012645 [Scortum barcoo]|uniref:Uncharacterized protein n=1 Tax=Scortum barcoo TaxID=214431 RepID=A0ACB8W545_9TELE|nr:hypothetical protein L3Q82_012645 [Scortum barcoo]